MHEQIHYLTMLCKNWARFSYCSLRYMRLGINKINSISIHFISISKDKTYVLTPVDIGSH